MTLCIQVIKIPPSWKYPRGAQRQRLPPSLRPHFPHTPYTKLQGNQGHTFINVRGVSFLSSLAALLLISRRGRSLLPGFLLLCWSLACGRFARGRRLLLSFWWHWVLMDRCRRSVWAGWICVLGRWKRAAPKRQVNGGRGANRESILVGEAWNPRVNLSSRTSLALNTGRVLLQSHFNLQKSMI